MSSRRTAPPGGPSAPASTTAPRPPKTIFGGSSGSQMVSVISATLGFTLTSLGAVSMVNSASEVKHARTSMLAQNCRLRTEP